MRLNSPLIDTTTLEVFSQELRLASDGGGAFDWLVGAFYQDIDRDYGQNLPTPGYDAFLARVGLPPSAAFNAPPDTPFFSTVPFTTSSSSRCSAKAPALHRAVEPDGRPALLRLRRGPRADVRGRVRRRGLHRSAGPTSSDGFSPRVILAFEPNDDVLLTAQVARGFRLGGINDPLNVDAVHADGSRDLQRPADLRGREGAELRARREDPAGRRPRHVQRRGVLFRHRRSAGDRRRRLLLVAHRAERAGESIGAEVELFARPNENWDFGLSATWVKPRSPSRG